MTEIHSKAYQAFLAKLRRAREEVRLTQVDAAKMLRKPQSYVSKCELGERRVDIIDLQKFAKIYKKSITYFNVKL